MTWPRCYYSWDEMGFSACGWKSVYVFPLSGKCGDFFFVLCSSFGSVVHKDRGSFYEKRKGKQTKQKEQQIYFFPPTKPSQSFKCKHENPLFSSFWVHIFVSLALSYLKPVLCSKLWQLNNSSVLQLSLQHKGNLVCSRRKRANSQATVSFSVFFCTTSVLSASFDPADKWKRWKGHFVFNLRPKCFNIIYDLKTRQQ